MKFKQAKELASYGVIVGFDAVRDILSDDAWRVECIFDDNLSSPVPLYNTHGDIKIYKTLDACLKDVERLLDKPVSKILLS